MESIALIGACGLYCGACRHYRSNFTDGSHLRHDQEGNSVLSCDGCHSERHTPWCSVCKIRLCAKRRGILGCGSCEAYPCVDLSTFQAFGAQAPKARHRCDVFAQTEQLCDVGATAWLAEMQEKWTCSCGTPFSYYETSCQSCGRPLHSYAAPNP